jgi:hypothetical protein
VEWESSLPAARSHVGFPIFVPDHPSANEANLIATYVRPGGAWVAMQFPAPTDADVQQTHIEVFLMPWEGGDPSEAYAENLAKDPVVGKGLHQVQGIVALGVTANSPTDTDQANPAYLELVYEGIEMQVSGGDSLERLIEIAESIVKSAPQVEATP